ncbi:MAG: hypothetical protein ABI885_10440 [Gammaproteobacteria bacterium]
MDDSAKPADRPVDYAKSIEKEERTGASTGLNGTDFDETAMSHRPERFVRGCHIDAEPAPFCGPTDSEKLVPRPRSERKSVADLLGRWPGEIDDGFEEAIREFRKSGRIGLRRRG